jgi:predicted nucleotide-binding protein
MENEPIKIFIAYSRQDSGMLEELRKQFYPLEISKKITVWYDGEIKPGEKWDERIQDELNAAEIILLLVSPDSISSEYFYESEVQKAIQRDNDGNIRVVQ